MKKENSILQLFPSSLRGYFEQTARSCEDLSEIRIRVDRPVLVQRRGNEFVLLKDGGEALAEANDITGALCLDAIQIENIFSYLCQYSPYAYGEALKQGFLTVAGGHRVGVAGQVIRTSGEISGIRNIRFMNIRISHEVKEVATPLIPFLYEPEGGKVHNCLIIAPPGCGKTTMLRDIVRQISDGSKEQRGCGVAVVDERSEIAGCFQGEPQNDVGIRTDVLDACPKAFGMEMMLRSMSPEVIAVDEIATGQDVSTLLLLMHCGVRVMATIHGDSVQEVQKKPYLRPLFEAEYFKRFLVIKPGGRASLYDENGEVLV